MSPTTETIASSVGIRRKGRPLGLRGIMRKKLWGGPGHDGVLKSRNQCDQFHEIGELDPTISDELLALADEKKTTMTVLAAVARFPQDQQRLMFEYLNRLGARAAKRYVENLLNPPTVDAIAKAVSLFLDREFPGADDGQIQQALADIVRALDDDGVDHD